MEDFLNKLCFTDINAFICLRLVMKFSESQARLYKRTILPERGNDGFVSPYEDILNNIVREIMRARRQIWGEDFGLAGEELDAAEKEVHIERLVEHFISLSENEVLISHNWNLNLGSGEEILSQLLKFSN